MRRRVDLKQILNNPKLRKELLVAGGLFLQQIEGIQTTRKQMIVAYNNIQKEKCNG
jgi:3-keto-L-gulonate-6-phosphate decarboxylase